MTLELPRQNNKYGDNYMEHTVHDNHSHVHSSNCGHTQIKHGDHIDYLHNGHLHAAHDNHFDECILAISNENPNVCKTTECKCEHNDCGHEKVPHGDHFDFLVNGRLHHLHDGHCDDHGAVLVM